MLLADGSIDWIALLERNGLATFLVLAFVFGAWKAAVFLAPKLTAATEAHLALVETLDTQTKRQTDLLENHGEAIKTLGVAVERHGNMLGEIHRRVSGGAADRHDAA